MNNRILTIFLFIFILTMIEISHSHVSDCDLPIDPGPCRRYRTRYAYSNIDRKCVSFVYGGCLGNANNFETMEACKLKCTRG
ncbi:trypsin inhibitor-like [Leptopilina boulardi]|uniref:trypsin inhibitor-like n=1 Tax=Leptopilina boulardi TaxID=63433 RepID=UPI0021F537D3|nr:trypsin inhibitor-like [Leptopilina boulardi]